MSDPAAKVVTRTGLTWTGDHLFSIQGKGKPVIVDGDSVEAPGPVEALLGALASCTATDVVDILNKRRTPPDTLEIETIGTRKSTHPRGLTHVVMEYRITGEGIDRANAERAIALALTKYCSVRDSLSRDIPVQWSLTLNGEAGSLNDESPPEIRTER